MNATNAANETAADAAEIPQTEWRHLERDDVSLTDNRPFAENLDVELR
jgi:hypothetical protein